MRCRLMFVAATMVTSGLVSGQEPQQPNEHLKGYGPFIGTWRYEGPVLADVPELAKKGSKCVVDFSWRWILDKQVVMHDWLVEFEGGKTLSGKALIGWNAADNTIVRGQMHSSGGMRMGTVVLDRQAKTITYTSEGTDEEGDESSSKTVVAKTDKDTLTWQAVERTGGDVEGESPVYTLERVKDGPRKTAANAGEVPEKLKDFGPFIGTWRYEGQLLEEIPNFCEKGAPIVVRMSMRRILDKKVVMEDWLMEFADGKKLSAKVLVGWNAADNKLALGIMNSVGALALGSVELDPKTKTYTMATKGVNREGEETSYQSVLKKTGSDTLTWHRLGASGGLVEDEGPVYELKRVKRTEGKKAAK